MLSICDQCRGAVKRLGVCMATVWLPSVGWNVSVIKSGSARSHRTCSLSSSASCRRKSPPLLSNLLRHAQNSLREAIVVVVCKIQSLDNRYTLATFNFSKYHIRRDQKKSSLSDVSRIPSHLISLSPQNPKLAMIHSSLGE